VKRVNITPAADRDADEVFAYIARDDPVAAGEQIQRLFRSAKRLAGKKQ
jgi:plasmid stabilization system protein ParE